MKDSYIYFHWFNSIPSLQRAFSESVLRVQNHFYFHLPKYNRFKFQINRNFNPFYIKCSEEQFSGRNVSGTFGGPEQRFLRVLKKKN